MDFWDLNKASPYDNFHIPFIDHIIDDYSSPKDLSFICGFSRDNYINMYKPNGHKIAFTIPWVMFA